MFASSDSSGTFQKSGEEGPTDLKSPLGSAKVCVALPCNRLVLIICNLFRSEPYPKAACANLSISYINHANRNSNEGFITFRCPTPSLRPQSKSMLYIHLRHASAKPQKCPVQVDYARADSDSSRRQFAFTRNRRGHYKLFCSSPSYSESISRFHE